MQPFDPSANNPAHRSAESRAESVSFSELVKLVNNNASRQTLDECVGNQEKARTFEKNWTERSNEGNDFQLPIMGI